jgi:predicted CoA-binding protein
MAEIVDIASVRLALERAPTIALLGASPRPSRPAHYVPAYLLEHGYRILPVNPVYAGQELFGETVRATLAELDEPVDMVDIFRRADDLPGHLDDLLAMVPRPTTVWLQLGIRHQAFTDRLVGEGFDVVQSRCTLADHRAWGLGAPRR